MSKGLWAILAVATMSVAVPASAQMSDRDVPAGGLARNQAECVAQFQVADLNGDGFLSPYEISESRSLIPTDLWGETRLSRQEFVSACDANTRNQGPG